MKGVAAVSKPCEVNAHGKEKVQYITLMVELLKM
jgi:hypothetical protein